MTEQSAAAPQRREFTRRLSWVDGLSLGLSIPVGGFALIGYSIGILGAWTAMLLWGITCVIAIAQNFIFAELAAMFPNKPGGIALYAHEGWRRYFTPVGALAAVGYWAGWSFGLAVYGLIIGQLLAAHQAAIGIDDVVLCLVVLHRPVGRKRLVMQLLDANLQPTRRLVDAVFLRL